MAASDQHYRNQKALDVVFGVSCVLLLLTTFWMFWQDYARDFKAVQRKFRDVEASMAEREMVDKLPDKATYTEKRVALRDARRELAKAQASVATTDRELKAKREQADEKYRGIKADFDANTSYYNIAVDDASKYPTGSPLASSYNAHAKQLKKKLDDLEKRLGEAKDKLDKIDADYRDQVRSVLEGPEKDVAAAEDDLKKTTGAFERYGKVAAQKNWDLGDTVRDLPILDGFAPPIKVNQIWLPDLTIDYSFKEVPRFDRCTTCHLGIDRPAMTKEALTKLGDDDENRRLTGKVIAAKEMLEKRSTKDLGFDPGDLPGKRRAPLGFITFLMVLCSLVAAGSLGVMTRSLRIAMVWLIGCLMLTLGTSAAMAAFAPQDPEVKTIKLDPSEVTQYAVHPRLDLFVDGNSPHSAEKLGCTICHAGQGSATDFNLAAHTPNDVTQEEHWKHHRGWEHSHYWDYPMLSKRFVESSCVKCHHQMTDLVRHGSKEEAPKLLRGYNLIKENGCFGCHEISGTKGGRPVGPDLRLEPAPALEYLSPADQERMRADTANPPGGQRKVGPSLRRLAEKTNEDWVRRWIQSPRGFRPDTKMPHFYGLSTNSPDALPESQKLFPAAEIHSIAHYLLTESKDGLSGKDFYRLALLDGTNNVRKLQAQLAYADLTPEEKKAKKDPAEVKFGLSDRDTKDLYDVTRRFVEVALLSAPLESKAINAHALRQRQLQERMVDLQKRLADLRSRDAAESELKPLVSEVASNARELNEVTDALVKVSMPTPLSQRIIGEDGMAVQLPGKLGDPAAGRRLFMERGCMACHSHEGTAKGDNPIHFDRNFAPELSRVAAKLTPALGKDGGRLWLVQWLLNPNIHHPRTRMPITHLKVEQANDIATWLLTFKADDWKGEDPGAPNEASLRALARVYLAKAPGMTRTDVDKFLPAEGDAPGIPADRLSALARDAEEHRLAEGKVSDESLKWYIGKKAIGKMGCYACHDIPGFETAKPIGTGLNDWGKKDPARLAFEDAETYAREHYNVVPTRTLRSDVEKRIKAIESKKDEDRTKEDSRELEKLQKQVDAQERIHELETKAESKSGLSSKESAELAKIRHLKFFEVHDKKEPVEEIFFQALEHQHREGFLHQKLLEPRSYDFNRERAWDDRLRMPQFKFARSRKQANESEEQYQARQEKEEAEAREAVMTFILGLTAEAVPLQYVNQPKAEKAAEVHGREVLEKYNCAGCHQIRPGVYEFKATPEALKLVQQAYQTESANFREDFVVPGHSAWTGTAPASERMVAYGYFDEAATKQAEDVAPGSDAIRLTDALRFPGADRVLRDLPAGGYLLLPRNGYEATAPFGGVFADHMVAYLMRKNPTLFPKDDPGKSRAVLPPPLVREGERVQPDWLYKFLLNPIAVRPESYMLLRMPKFNMSPEEARALVNYFAAVSRTTNPGAGVTYPYVSIDQRDEKYWEIVAREYASRLKAKGVDARAKEMQPVWEAKAKKELADLEAALPGMKKAEAEAKEKKAPDLTDRSNALKKALARIDELKANLKKGAFPNQKKRWESGDIYARDAFKLLSNAELCLKCHEIGNIRIEGAQGPNLALAAERLRPDWTEQWIAHPKRLFTYQPVMPQNFPNEPDPLKWKFQDTFVGSPLQQIRGVRDILMDQQKLNELLSAPTPAAKPTPPATPPKKEEKKK
jgi:mono/diheme cytochrome c family protein